MREDIINTRERERQGRLEEQALDQLIAAHPFELPPSLIRQEQESLVREQIQFMQSHGLQLESLDPEKMVERGKPKAS